MLGDFNLDRRGDPLYAAFLSTGLWPPAELDHVPRTVFDNDKESHFYDQIAWFSDTTQPGPPSVGAGCATLSKSLAGELVKHPGRFYVNVHTNEFPNSAARGPLAHPKG